jgi:hypothetical protein
VEVRTYFPSASSSSLCLVGDAVVTPLRHTPICSCANSPTPLSDATALIHSLPITIHVLIPLCRSWPRDIELPQARGCATQADGVAAVKYGPGWRGLLVMLKPVSLQDGVIVK